MSTLKYPSEQITNYSLFIDELIRLNPYHTMSEMSNQASCVGKPEHVRALIHEFQFRMSGYSRLQRQETCFDCKALCDSSSDESSDDDLFE